MQQRQQILLLFPALTILSACGPPAEPAIDHITGRECFELHLDRLPPGAQYEGVASGDETRFEVRVMDGVKLVTVQCEIDAAGNVRVASGQKD
jgi:hypothetical protein